MKYITAIALFLLVSASSAYANEERGGCGNRRCESDETVEDSRKKGDYQPPDNGGPDSRHGSGTR